MHDALVRCLAQYIVYAAHTYSMIRISIETGYINRYCAINVNFMYRFVRVVALFQPGSHTFYYD